MVRQLIPAAMVITPIMAAGVVVVPEIQMITRAAMGVARCTARAAAAGRPEAAIQVRPGTAALGAAMQPVAAG